MVNTREAPVMVSTSGLYMPTFYEHEDFKSKLARSQTAAAVFGWLDAVMELNPDLTRRSPGHNHVAAPLLIVPPSETTSGLLISKRTSEDVDTKTPTAHTPAVILDETSAIRYGMNPQLVTRVTAGIVHMPQHVAHDFENVLTIRQTERGSQKTINAHIGHGVGQQVFVEDTSKAGSSLEIRRRELALQQSFGDVLSELGYERRLLIQSPVSYAQRLAEICVAQHCEKPDL